MSLTETQRHTMTEQTVAEWAREMIDNPGTFFLDTETTGVGYDAEIIEIGVCDRDGNTLLDTRVKPVKPIPPGATKVHGISDADVADAPRWPSVYLDLRFIFRDYPNGIIYNLEFDTRLLNQSNDLWHLPNFYYHQAPYHQWHCAMMQYCLFKHEWDHRRKKYRWHKLTDAVQHFGLTVPDDAHSALSDARSTARIVHEMAKHSKELS